MYQQNRLAKFCLCFTTDENNIIADCMNLFSGNYAIAKAKSRGLSLSIMCRRTGSGLRLCVNRDPIAFMNIREWGEPSTSANYTFQTRLPRYICRKFSEDAVNSNYYYVQTPLELLRKMDKTLTFGVDHFSRVQL